MISRLHMRHLRLLVALEDAGSLLKAADRVGLTQPGASKALQEIEVLIHFQSWAILGGVHVET